MDVLNLPGFKITRVQENDNDMLLNVEPTENSLGCPHCGVFNPRLYGHGTKQVDVFDLPIRNKRVKLRLNLHRFMCRECGKTHLERHYAIDEHRRMTVRLIKHIQHEGMCRPFTDVAGSIGTTEGTIRNIVKEYICRLERQYSFKTPEWLGIDEIHILGKARGVFTNIKERTVIELTVNRHTPTMKAVMDGMKNKEVVKAVTSDMWKPYHAITAQSFPKATMVVDKFHIVRMANIALDQVRKHIGGQNAGQKKTLMRKRWCLLKRRKDLNQRQEDDLQIITERYPELKIAYELKEKYFCIYNAKTKQMARAQVADWLYSVPKEMERYFGDLITSTINFQESILNYWDYPITNALTESLNRNIRTLTRDARGYSFKVLRAKLLFSGGHKVSSRPAWSGGDFYMGLPHESDNFGVPISTFMDMINKLEAES